MDWKDIEEIVSEAAESGDPVLSRVRDLRLDINHFSMMLWNPYDQVTSQFKSFFQSLSCKDLDAFSWIFLAKATDIVFKPIYLSRCNLRLRRLSYRNLIATTKRERTTITNPL